VGGRRLARVRVSRRHGFNKRCSRTSVGGPPRLYPQGQVVVANRRQKLPRASPLAAEPDMQLQADVFADSPPHVAALSCGGRGKPDQFLAGTVADDEVKPRGDFHGSADCSRSPRMTRAITRLADQPGFRRTASAAGHRRAVRRRNTAMGCRHLSQPAGERAPTSSSAMAPPSGRLSSRPRRIAAVAGVLAHPEILGRGRTDRRLQVRPAVGGVERWA
jgi:hypothetical protein